MGKKQAFIFIGLVCIVALTVVFNVFELSSTGQSFMTIQCMIFYILAVLYQKTRQGYLIAALLVALEYVSFTGSKYSPHKYLISHYDNIGKTRSNLFRNPKSKAHPLPEAEDDSDSPDIWKKKGMYTTMGEKHVVLPSVFKVIPFSSPKIREIWSGPPPRYYEGCINILPLLPNMDVADNKSCDITQKHKEENINKALKKCGLSKETVISILLTGSGIEQLLALIRTRQTKRCLDKIDNTTRELLDGFPETEISPEVRKRLTKPHNEYNTNLLAIYQFTRQLASEDPDIYAEYSHFSFLVQSYEFEFQRNHNVPRESPQRIRIRSNEVTYVSNQTFESIEALLKVLLEKIKVISCKEEKVTPITSPYLISKFSAKLASITKSGSSQKITEEEFIIEQLNLHRKWLHLLRAIVRIRALRIELIRKSTESEKNLLDDHMYLKYRLYTSLKNMFEIKPRNNLDTNHILKCFICQKGLVCGEPYTLRVKYNPEKMGKSGGFGSSSEKREENPLLPFPENLPITLDIPLYVEAEMAGTEKIRKGVQDYTSSVLAMCNFSDEFIANFQKQPTTGQAWTVTDSPSLSTIDLRLEDIRLSYLLFSNLKNPPIIYEKLIKSRASPTYFGQKLLLSEA